MLKNLVNKLTKTSPQAAHKLWLKALVFTQAGKLNFGLGIKSRVVRFLNTFYSQAFTHALGLNQQMEAFVYKHNPHSLLMKLKESKVII
jgi:hypothetical protein